MSAARRAALCCAYFWLVMTSYYILKPIRESFFLQELGFKRYPVAHLAVLAVCFVAIQVYSRLARRMALRHFVVATNATFAAIILAFWLALGPGGAAEETRRQLAFVYFVWVSIFSVFSVTLFWTLTHSVFEADEGKTWYGVVGAGGTVGAMTGGQLTHLLAERWGTIDLLLVSAAVLLPCGLLGAYIAANRTRPAEAASPPKGEAPRPAAPPQRSAMGLVWDNPLLRGIAFLMLVGLFIAILDDMRFKQVIQLGLPELDGRTAYMGQVFFATNVVGLIVGLGLTGPLQKRFGPGPGLMTYPLAVVAGGVALATTPTLDVVFWVIVAQQSVAYSIFQSSRELLYLRTDPVEKVLAKGVIGTFIFRLGTASAAVFAILFPSLLGVQRTSWITLPAGLVLAWIGLDLARQFAALGTDEE